AKLHLVFLAIRILHLVHAELLRSAVGPYPHSRRILLDNLAWQFCLEEESYAHHRFTELGRSACVSFDEATGSAKKPLVDINDGTNYTTRATNSSWKPVQLPHDFLSGLAPNENGSVNHGFIPFRAGWYALTLGREEVQQLCEGDSPDGAAFFLHFDGVIWSSTTWVNGRKKG
ncbi:unnamed protein product, partial [Amoebophrya sp. A25]